MEMSTPVVAGGLAVAACGVYACTRSSSAAPEPAPSGASASGPAGLTAPDAELSAEAVAALATIPPSLPGVYSYYPQTGDFTLDHTEEGVPYGKTEKEKLNGRAALNLKSRGFSSPFEFAFDSSPCVEGGVNFAGRVVVTHADGAAFTVLVPGKLTYDLAGRTGDPHASERVGNS